MSLNSYLKCRKATIIWGYPSFLSIVPSRTVKKWLYNARRAVVASSAVVTKDVEPYTIVGGTPAKMIVQRENKNYTYKPNFDIHIF